MFLLFALIMHGKSLTLCCFKNKQKNCVICHANKSAAMTAVIVIVLLSALDTLVSVQGRNTLHVDSSLA